MNVVSQVQAFISKVLTRCMIHILSCGPIPRHIAFVMDGNRRYARIKGMKAQEGHGEGFESLKRVCGPYELHFTNLTDPLTR